MNPGPEVDVKTRLAEIEAATFRIAALLLIDSSVPMYPIASPHLHKTGAQRLLEKIHPRTPSPGHLR